MAINLAKGQKIDLTKTNPTVKSFRIGLGWSANAAVGASFDIDVSAFILDENQKRVTDAHFVFYNNLKSPNDFVVHTGDNTTGVGEGDDETILVDFSKATEKEKSIVFVVTINDAESKRQNFGQISNSYIRILNNENNEEIMKFDLNEDYSIETAVTFGKLYLKDGEWKFEAVGTGMRGGLQEYLNIY